jgi:hypothetical protein
MKYKVLIDGFVAGTVVAATDRQALSNAEAQYGPGVTLEAIPEGEPEETTRDRMELRSLRVLPQYFYASIHHKGPVGFICDTVSDWFKQHIGIRVVTISDPILVEEGIAEDPETGEELHSPAEDIWVVYVTWYALLEVPTVKTLEEAFGLSERITAEVEFLYKLLHEMPANWQLFDYAHELGVEWLHSDDPRVDRLNCVQAIRRHFGWI